MKRFFERFTRSSQVIVVVFLMLIIAESYGQIGNVIWEENFNNLENNYPNPFSDRTTISYTLSKAEPVELNIYDMTGRVVRSLVNETQTAGKYRVDWQITDETPGIYFYELKAGGNAVTRKCVVK